MDMNELWMNGKNYLTRKFVFAMMITSRYRILKVVIPDHGGTGIAQFGKCNMEVKK